MSELQIYIVLGVFAVVILTIALSSIRRLPRQLEDASAPWVHLLPCPGGGKDRVAAAAGAAALRGVRHRADVRCADDDRGHWPAFSRAGLCSGCSGVYPDCEGLPGSSGGGAGRGARHALRRLAGGRPS